MKGEVNTSELKAANEVITMDPKLKKELLKLALAMRKARQGERRQVSVKKDECPAKNEPDALAIAARQFVEEEKRQQDVNSLGERP